MKNIIPIDQNLKNVDSFHESIVAILNQLRINVVQSREQQPWKAPRWKTAKIIAQHLEEVGLLLRLQEGEKEQSIEEMISLIDELMGCCRDKSLAKETGDYHELFLSETAIALIHALEYFSEFLTTQQHNILEKNLSVVSEKLWRWVSSASLYKIRTQGRLAWNHSVFVHAVLGMCVIKLDNQANEDRLSHAILWVEGYLSHSFTWDGFSREGIFYAGATRMPILLFIMALKEHRSIDLLRHSGLINHCQYLINEWIPNSSQFISRNDMNHLQHSTTLSSLLLYANLYQSEKALALWETALGVKGSRTFGNPVADSNRNGSLVLNYLFYPSNIDSTIPVESYVDSFKVYREAGVVVGYSKQLNSFKYSFQASSYYSDIHSQSDHGQIYLYLNGDILLGDTSVGNNRNIGTAGQSEGHNTLMIDGEGMSLSGAGWQTCSILEDAKCYGDYHVIRANLTPAYNAYHSRTTLAQYKRLVLVHTVEPYHIVVVDSVCGFHNIEHEYKYRFHTDRNHSIDNEQDIILIDTPNSKLQIVPLAIDWAPQNQESFVFNNEIRSNYIDSLFSGKDFLGGFVLVPSSKEAHVSVIRSNDEVTLKSGTLESAITLHMKSNDLINDILSCHSSRDGGIKNTIKIKAETGRGFDHLTGSIVAE